MNADGDRPASRGFAAHLQASWYRPQAPAWPLRALASVYGAVAGGIAARRRRQAESLPVPVIVVGNLSVGGTGKTPLVLAVVEQLRALGRRPGIISRGYGGRAPHYPLRVDAETPAAWCGDEPALLAQRSGAPLAVGADRLAAARLLLDSGEIDVLVADDGLQHHRLMRDLELCVVDGRRGLGNQHLLPAGPLREPAQRLRSVDLIVVNGGGWRPPEGLTRAPLIDMRLHAEAAVALADPAQQRPLRTFAGGRVHAVAGIGDPPRFFDMLAATGIEVVAHAFADHHAYQRAELQFGEALPLLMTEKDAVKCRAFALPDAWYVPVQAQFDADGIALLQTLLLDTLAET